jgi:hypothetical protein
LRRRGRTRRGRGLQVDDFAGLGLDLRRVDETITAHPDRIISFGQIGYQITALVIGDDDFREFGRKIGRLGDNPDSRLRAVRLVTTPPRSLLSIWTAVGAAGCASRRPGIIAANVANAAALIPRFRLRLVRISPFLPLSRWHGFLEAIIRRA